MKKITRRSFLAAMAAVSAAGVLTACAGSGNAVSSAVSESAAVSSEAVSSTASADETGTHTVIDHGGNEVEVPNKVTRVVIDQIPILSTYIEDTKKWVLSPERKAPQAIREYTAKHGEIRHLQREEN